MLLTAELSLQSRFGITLGAKLQSVDLLKSSCLGFPSAEIPGTYQHIWKVMFHVLELCKQRADCGVRDSGCLFFFFFFTFVGIMRKTSQISRVFQNVQALC